MNQGKFNFLLNKLEKAILNNNPSTSYLVFEFTMHLEEDTDGNVAKLMQLLRNLTIAREQSAINSIMLAVIRHSKVSESTLIELLFHPKCDFNMIAIPIANHPNKTENIMNILQTRYNGNNSNSWNYLFSPSPINVGIPTIKETELLKFIQDPSTTMEELYDLLLHRSSNITSQGLRDILARAIKHQRNILYSMRCYYGQGFDVVSANEPIYPMFEAILRNTKLSEDIQQSIYDYIDRNFKFDDFPKYPYAPGKILDRLIINLFFNRSINNMLWSSEKENDNFFDIDNFANIFTLMRHNDVRLERDIFDHISPLIKHNDFDDLMKNNLKRNLLEKIVYILNVIKNIPDNIKNLKNYLNDDESKLNRIVTAQLQFHKIANFFGDDVACAILQFLLKNNFMIFKEGAFQKQSLSEHLKDLRKTYRSKITQKNHSTKNASEDNDETSSSSMVKGEDKTKKYIPSASCNKAKTSSSSNDPTSELQPTQPKPRGRGKRHLI